MPISASLSGSSTPPTFCGGQASVSMSGSTTRSRTSWAGKTPMFIKVWSEWQHAGRPCKPFVPFADAMGDIAKERSVVGDGGVLHLDGTSPLHFRERRRHGAGSRAGQDRWLHPSLRPRREELRPTRPERVHTATAGAGATHVPWDPARSIDIDGGRVNCVPDINDHDSRLLAGGP